MAARAFTLVEIAIALALVALAVTSSLLLFPTGIKAQQLARFRLYAAAKAQEMVECFAACANGNANIDTESFAPWDLPIGYRATTPDLETRLATHQFGIAPLPLDLARRIDSDGDEIARILDQGGYVYYSAPQATTGLDPTASSARVPNELQKLVFAVSGYAQNNSLYSFPWKGWPYYVPYPSPPMHGLHFDQYLPGSAQKYVFPGGGGPRQSACWESCDPDDPGAADIGVVFEHEEGGLAYGYRPYAYDARLDGPSRDAALAETSDKRAAAVRYVQAALWYARKVGMPDELWSDPPLVAPTGFWGGADPSPPAAKQVLATRFLAHAGLCLTRWFSLAELGGQPSAPGGGVHCAAVSLAGAMSPDAYVTHDKIVAWHEACMNLVMTYAASFPYDWGAPRPTNRATMMDFPLIEWDLSDRAALLSGPIDGGGGTATQWRPLPATPIANAGKSYQFPTKPFDAVWSAHRDRVTITAPFDACERCRQLVFWSVDWQSYEDFETAPSAPLDASKYPLAGPLLDGGGSPLSFDARMDFLAWVDQHAMFRNPEKLLVFRSSVAGLPTGADVSALRENDSVAFEAGQDKGVGNAHIFCGVFGADRNCNDRLDRGPVPPSARLRATRIARFNFYDPRVPLTIR